MQYLVKIGGFFYWEGILGGVKKMILRDIFQYFLKIGVLFHMPRTNVLWHGFTK